MRSLPPSLTIVAVASLIIACGQPVQDETAASVSRDSSLRHDLKLAFGDTFAAPGEKPQLPSNGSPLRVATSRTNATNMESRGSIGPVAASCASPALSDQRRCLLSYLARSDVSVDRNYQALISRLKQEAGTAANGRDPASVVRLRSAQRNWLAYRDEACRRRNAGKEGPLWAPTRAQCLAEYGDQRTRELANALATRKATSAPGTKRATPKTARHAKPRARHR